MNLFPNIIMTFLFVLGGYRSSRPLVSSFLTSSNKIFGTATNRISSGSISSKSYYNSKQNQQIQSSIPTRALFSSTSNDKNNDDDKKSPPSNKKSKKKPTSKKIKINPNWKQEFDGEALSKAFDDLAKEEGFDSNYSYFDDEAYTRKKRKEKSEGDEEEGDEDMDEMEEEDILLANYEMEGVGKSSGNSMADRLAAAQTDLSLNKISTSSSFDSSPSALRNKMGLKYEAEPFGSDETPRNPNIYKLISNALNCPGCGVSFQSDDEDKPGFIPETKFDVQTKLGKIEDARDKFEEKKKREWSADDEVDWLQRQIDSDDDLEEDEDEEFDATAMAKELNLNLTSLSITTQKKESKEKKRIICKRCHNLQNYGTVPPSLRAGYSDSPLLSQESFSNLLKPIRTKNAIIIVLVDLFDFAGSILPELDSIVGPDNPVIIAANKADLLPKSISQLRIETWVRSELQYLGIDCIKNKGGTVRLISCKNGYGVLSLIEKAKKIAQEKGRDAKSIYVIGAANAGKSTFMNFFLDKDKFVTLDPTTAKKKKKRIRKGDTNAKKGSITTSPLPGTTLEFIKVDLSGKIVLYDTPGLLIPGTLTHLLTPEELKMVVPKKPVEAVTFRVEPGKCVLLGGLARIELKENCKPFLFTFFISNEVKLHVTDTAKVDDLLSKHLGEMLSPPLVNVNSTSDNPIQERLDELGEFEYHDLEIQGQGWKEAAVDIALRGLGWVAVTGPGVANVRVAVPKGIGVSVRPPLMPYDIWKSTAKYTGSRAVRKGGRMMSGKNRSGIGRR